MKAALSSQHIWDPTTASLSLLMSFLGHAQYGTNQPALIWRGEEVSYGTLGRMAERAQAAIRALELTPDEVLGVVAKKSPASIALVLGCMRARRPFLLPSAELGQVTLAALLQQAGCRRVLTTDPDRERALLVDVSADARAIGDEPGPTAPSPDEISFMLTTSGSTGVPKIVPLSVGAVDRFSDWSVARFGMGPGVTVLNYAPLSFDLCLLDIWSTLKAGGRVALVDQDQAMNPRYLIGLLASSEARVIQAVPILYRLLLDATRSRGQRFESVEHIIFTGYAMPPELLAELPALFPRARFYNIYGCTETNDSFLHEVDARPAAGPVPIGLPLPGVQAFVADEQGAEIAGAGVGELFVSTPFQARGYLDGGAGDKFVVRAGRDGDRIWFRTGDLVRRDDDGTLTVIGRTDFQVKVRGVGVNLEEVERVILEHDQVAEAAVAAIPDQMAGYRLEALVRRQPSGTVNSLELRTHCAHRLPRVAIPSTIQLTERQLPRTATGKVDRRRIKDMLTEEPK